MSQLMEAHQASPANTQVAPAASARHTGRHAKALRLSLAALLVVALILFAVLLLFRGHHGKTTVPPVGAPAGVSEAQLEALASHSNHPIYWAGPKSDVYELTRTADGRIYVRYLPRADKVGDRSAMFLTIGTYPARGAFLALKRAAARSGGISASLPRGGLMVFNEHTATSVYFSYPGAPYQVEVFDPSPQEARALVLGGKITPIK